MRLDSTNVSNKRLMPKHAAW